MHPTAAPVPSMLETVLDYRHYYSLEFPSMDVCKGPGTGKTNNNTPLASSFNLFVHPDAPQNPSDRYVRVRVIDGREFEAGIPEFRVREQDIFGGHLEEWWNTHIWVEK